MAGRSFHELQEDHPRWWVLSIIVLVMAVTAVWATLHAHRAQALPQGGADPPAQASAPPRSS